MYAAIGSAPMGARVSFANGTMLAEVRAALVGVRLEAALGEHGDRRPRAWPSVYQITNVTRSALILAPLMGGIPRLDRRRSVDMATGVSRGKSPRDVVLYLHPEQLALLHSLLGLSAEQAWRQPGRRSAEET